MKDLVLEFCNTSLTGGKFVFGTNFRLIARVFDMGWRFVNLCNEFMYTEIVPELRDNHFALSVIPTPKPCIFLLVFLIPGIGANHFCFGISISGISFFKDLKGLGKPLRSLLSSPLLHHSTTSSLQFFAFQYCFLRSEFIIFNINNDNLLMTA